MLDVALIEISSSVLKRLSAYHVEAKRIRVNNIITYEPTLRVNTMTLNVLSARYVRLKDIVVSVVIDHFMEEKKMSESTVRSREV